MKATAQDVVPGVNRVALLAVLYGAAFLAGFNENMMNMALMSIMGEYGVGSVTAQWLVTGYMIVATVVVVCMAFLYRRFKLRALFFAAAAFTAAGSLMGLFAMNFPLLLVARLVQAIGSGIFIPMMMNTILAVAPKNRLGTFMSIGGCMITFGPALAPVVCGMLVTALGWHSVFVVPLAVMAVLALLGCAFVKNLSNEDAHLDLPSVGLAAVFLFALSFGLSQVASNAVLGAVFLAAAVAAAAVFAVRQTRCDYPLIDMAPMRSVRFWPAVLLVVVAMMTTFSLSVLLPLYFEGAMGMTAFMAGVLILVPVLVNAGCTLAAGRVMDRRGEWPLLPCGFGLVLVGAVAMVFAAPALAAPAMFVAMLAVYAGIGLCFSPSQTAGLRTLPPQQNPFGVALMTTFVQVAACIGPSLFTGIMSSAQAGALAAGASESLAAAEGFAAAIRVASAIAAAGFAVALVYSLAAHRRDAVARRAAEGSPVAAAPAEGAASRTSAATPLADATLAQVMGDEPFTVASDARVRDAMRVLVEHRVSGLAVVDGQGAPVGFVSDGDIMRYLATQHPLVTSAYSLIEAAGSQTIDERMAELMDLPVGQIATSKVVVLGAGTSLKDACQLLAQHRFKKVPVVSDGRVVGVVSRSNVLRFAMESCLAAEGADAGAEQAVLAADALSPEGRQGDRAASEDGNA